MGHKRNGTKRKQQKQQQALECQQPPTVPEGEVVDAEEESCDVTPEEEVEMRRRRKMVKGRTLVDILAVIPDYKLMDKVSHKFILHDGLYLFKF